MAGITPAMLSIVQRAAGANRVPFALADAENGMEEARTKAIKEAAGKGVPLFVSRSHVKLMDGSERWPTVLAELLCEHPKKAKLSNDVLMRDVSGVLKLDGPLLGNRMSKAFSVAACTRVKSVLSKHGFDGSNVKNGTDIKRLVAGGKHLSGRRGGRKEVSTVFRADGVVLDGTKYKYRRRERSPMGLPWQDFCIRVAGADVPLSAVLALRNIGMQEFIGQDAIAIAYASREELGNRDNVAREAKPINQRKLCPRCLGKLSDKSPRITTSELVRAWFLENPAATGDAKGLQAMINYFAEIEDDPVAIGKAKKAIDSWSGSSSRPTSD